MHISDGGSTLDKGSFICAWNFESCLGVIKFNSILTQSPIVYLCIPYEWMDSLWMDEYIPYEWMNTLLWPVCLKKKKSSTLVATISAVIKHNRVLKSLRSVITKCHIQLHAFSTLFLYKKKKISLGSERHHPFSSVKGFLQTHPQPQLF